MTTPAGISLMRRPFGLPVALSLAIHGLAVAALGTFSFSPTVIPAQNQGINVDLVTLKQASVVRTRPVAPKPEARRVSVAKARPVAVKRASPRSTVRISSRVRSVTTPVAMPAVAPSPVAPTELDAAPEAPPSFKELPRVPVAAASPAAVFAQASALSLPEPLEVTVSLTASIGEVTVYRPLPGASSGQARLLRDSTPDTGSVRSKVRPGNNPRPEYPRAAREAGWQGTVVLQVLVLPDGSAGNVTLYKTSGHPVLDDAALSAVKGWQFIPAMDGNFPVQSVVRMPVRFDLKAAN
jgi:protein TonB